MDAKAYKEEGNKAFQQKRYKDSINSYTKAIELSPNDHVLYSNRSGSYASEKDYQNALKDAQKCVEIKPDWAKGYQRLGFAHFYLNDYEDALEAYESGLQIDPSNVQLQDGKQRCEECLESAAPGGEDFSGAGGADGAGAGMFGDGMLQKILTGLQANPQTAEYLKDPGFLKNLFECSQNPMLFLTLGQQDKRLARAFQIMTGTSFDFQNPQVPNPDDVFGKNKSQPNQEVEKPKPAPEAAPKPPPEPLDEADQIKNQGNNLYKQKKFVEALECYQKAISLKPNEVLYYNNKAAVFIEMGKLKEAMDECERAIKIIDDTEVSIQFQSKGQVYARKAAILLKQENVVEAQVWYEKSLIEFQDPQVKDELKKIDKILKELKEKEYINPAAAEEANNRGKELFNAGQFPDALREYEEASKRNPADAQYDFNQGLCRTKLMDWHNALRHFEICLQKDPKYEKAYIKRGTVHIALREYDKAMEMFEAALQIDPNSKDAAEGLHKAEQYCIYGPPGETEDDKQKRIEHNAKDPEIQNILRIPEVVNALKSMTTPEDCQKVMSDPFLKPKILKLIRAGIVSMK